MGVFTSHTLANNIEGIANKLAWFAFCLNRTSVKGTRPTRASTNSNFTPKYTHPDVGRGGTETCIVFENTVLGRLLVPENVEIYFKTSLGKCPRGNFGKFSSSNIHTTKCVWKFGTVPIFIMNFPFFSHTPDPWALLFPRNKINYQRQNIYLFCKTHKTDERNYLYEVVAEKVINTRVVISNIIVKYVSPTQKRRTGISQSRC